MHPRHTRIDAPELERFVSRVLAAAGARRDDAAATAAHLVEADLKGHDSHGSALLPTYLEHIRGGLVTLDATDRTIRETPVLLQVDANGGWGVPATHRLIARAIEKAKGCGLAAATLSHAHHIGRIGAYAEQAAEAGLVSLHFVNVTDHAPLVAPYRGSDARFGTNPVCIAFPATQARPAFVHDMATSRIAMGKVRVAAARGQPVTPGCLIDARGMPTTNPAGMAGFEMKGALTPAGLHKGYGLAFACEFLAGILSGNGTIQPQNSRRGGLQNALFSVLVDPSAFGDPDWMEREMDAMADYALASPPMDWDSPVLYPGAPERAFEGKRRREGIPMDAVTVKALNDVAISAGSSARIG